MNRRTKSKQKKINPIIWVFCEGKTEEVYVKYLRSKYRLPIEITCRITGQSISVESIRKSKNQKPTHPKDKDYLIYDGDDLKFIDKLKRIPSEQIIITTPSVELWFLYHYKNQTTQIQSKDCINELSKRNNCSYKKGYIDDKLREKLEKECNKACQRAKDSKIYENPSSNMFLLIEELEKIKNEKIANH